MRFGIPDYAPSGHLSSDSLIDTFGDELQRLLGCRICCFYSMWSVHEEGWHETAPIVMELDDFQFEICNCNLHELLLTFNGINLNDKLLGERRPDSAVVPYEWRMDRRELSAYIGAFIIGADLIEYHTYEWILNGIGFRTTKGYFAILNGLDRNLIITGQVSQADLRRVMVF